MKRHLQILLAVAAAFLSAITAPAADVDKRPHVPSRNLSFARVAAKRLPQTSGTKRRSARRRRRTGSTQSSKTATSEAQTPTHRISPTTSQGPLSQVTYELPLRKPGAGEQRAQGLLTDVACDAKGVTFKITAGDKLLRLWAPDLNRIHFATYTPEVSGEIICGVRRPANMVVVVYRPAKVPGAKSDGTPVAVEFVPKNFK
jgi:hypothetical protein